MSERTLPPGWVWTTLEDTCEIIMGQSPPSETYNEEGIGLPFYQGKAEFGDLYPAPVKWCSEPKKIAEADDILISVRAPVGPTNLCREKSCIGRGLAAIRPRIEMGSLYFLYWLRYIEQEWDSKATGTTFKAISGSVLRTQEIPLPPLPEQHRIVAEIEKQLTRLDAGVAALRRAQANLRRYKAAVLKAACEGRLVPQDPADEPASALLQRILAERRQRWEAEQIARGKDPKKLKYKEPAPPDTSELPELPEGWAWATVEQIGAIGEQAVLTGPFGSNLGRSDFIASGVPVLTIGCLTEQGLSLDKAFYVSDAKAFELKRYRVKSGDLLFSRMATVGRAGMVTTKFEGAIINYHLMRLRLAEDVINPIFFISYVRGAETVVDYVREVNHGATRDGINTRQLLALPVALPPLAEQQRIVAEVERRLSVVEELEAAVEANLKRAERLRQAVLKRAFEGKLVPQDPDDEPASLLLECIRAEREGLESGGKSNRKSSRQQKKGRGKVSDKQLRLL
jgi:type I restriction enzyme S subunit